MSIDYDVAIIGSGFGGAVCAYRLAAAGFKVCVLERGKRWTPDTYPRKPEDDWLWKKECPREAHGWIDLHTSPNITVMQGAGVGGGSLIYSGVTIDAEEVAFAQAGWPTGVAWFRELKECYYPKVETVLQPETLPETQFTTRTKLIKEAADAIDQVNQFTQLGLAIHFDANFQLDQFQTEEELIQQGTLAQHAEDGFCIHLGTCNIGCKVGAKKTLDTNYLKRAEKYGAEILPLHLVKRIEPLDVAMPQNGYSLLIEDLATATELEKTLTATIVVVAAGSLGSTELLLRCQVAGALPNLSQQLGKKWSYNGDVNTLALYPPTQPINPARGPHTTAKISFMGGEDASTERYVIEDAGFPSLLYQFLKAKASQPLLASVVGEKLPGILQMLAQYQETPSLTDEAAKQLEDKLIALFQQVFAPGQPVADPQIQGFVQLVLNALKTPGVLPTDFVMPWFAQGLDAGNGQISLKFMAQQIQALHTQAEVFQESNLIRYLLRRVVESLTAELLPLEQNIWDFWQWLITNRADLAKKLTLLIEPGDTAVFNAVRQKHREIIQETGGFYLPTDDVHPGQKNVHVITTHPLGGCPMGDTLEEGVVDHKGEVFNYPNLYVADGSIIPTAIGANPSKTIAALAERIAALLVTEKQNCKLAY